MSKPFIRLAAVLASVIFATTAQATIYQHDIVNPQPDDPHSNNAGDIKDFSVSFNSGTKDFSGSYTIERQHGRLANSAWLVVSPGPNPKADEDNLAILYMDFESGTTWAYQYNGENNPTSYEDSRLIQRYDNSVAVVNTGNDLKSVSFSVNAAPIQSHDSGSADWSGVGFGEKVGVWFHPAIASITPSADGGIESYYVQNGWHQSWYDTSTGQYTTIASVPEISTSSAFSSLLLLAGLGAFIRERRSRKTARSIVSS